MSYSYSFGIQDKIIFSAKARYFEKIMGGEIPRDFDQMCSNAIGQRQSAQPIVFGAQGKIYLSIDRTQYCVEFKMAALKNEKRESDALSEEQFL